MTQTKFDQFKAAVLKAEQTRDAGPLAAMFAGDATLDSPAHESPVTGSDGALEFWQKYLDAFTAVTSTFGATHALGETAAMEWQSHGTLPTGKSVDYRGVSIVTFAGDKVRRFVTYYDSAQFVAETASAIPDGATNDNGGD